MYKVCLKSSGVQDDSSPAACCREEDEQRPSGGKPGVALLKAQVLQEGLLLAGRRFSFLGCSSSQLRSNHACWMTSLEVRTAGRRQRHWLPMRV